MAIKQCLESVEKQLSTSTIIILALIVITLDDVASW